MPVKWTNEMLIKYFLDRLASHHDARPGTLKSYRHLMLSFANSIGMEIVELTPSLLSDWFIHYSVSAKRNSRRTMLACLKSFFREVQHILPELKALQIAVSSIRPIRKEEVMPYIFSQDDLFRMIVMASEAQNQNREESLFVAMRNAAIIAVLADTGIRLGELSALKVRNIVLKHSQGNASPYYLLRVPAIKTAIARDVPFGKLSEGSLIGETFSRYYLYLTERYKADPMQPLWPVWDGKDLNLEKGLSKVRIQDIIRWLMKKLELDHVTPHTFRHFYATYSIVNGRSLMEVKDLLGHSDISTTARYVHIATLQKYDFGKNPAAALKAPVWLTGTAKLQKNVNLINKNP